MDDRELPETTAEGRELTVGKDADGTMDGRVGVVTLLEEELEEEVVLEINGI